jgi:tetratricopeptide (TPR) repeat protein
VVRFSLLFVVFLHFSLQAQEAEQLRLKFLKGTENKLNLASKLREIYIDESPDSLFSLGSNLVNEGLNQDNQSWIIFGKMIIGNFYYYKNKPEISLNYLLEAEKYYKKRNDLEKLSDVQNLIGMALVLKLEYNEAANYFIKSLTSSDGLGEDNQKYMGQINLADVYFRQEKYELAESEVLSFLHKAQKQNLSQAQRKGNEFLAKVYLAKGEADLAKEYARKAFKFAMENPSKFGKANAYTNLAITYFESGEDNLALLNFQKALEIRLETKQARLISEAYFNVGEWHFYMEKYKEAIPHYETALKYAQENEYLVEEADALRQLSACYKALGNYQKALEISENYIKKMRTIHKKNQEKDIDFQRLAYELDVNERNFLQKKREDKITSRMEQEQYRGKVIMLGFAVLIILLIVFYIFQQISNRFKKNKSQDPGLTKDEIFELQVLSSKMDKINQFVDNQSKKHTFKDAHLIGAYYVLSIHSTKQFCISLSYSNIENHLIVSHIKKHFIQTEDELKECLLKLSFIPQKSWEVFSIELSNHDMHIHSILGELVFIDFTEKKSIILQTKSLKLNDFMLTKSSYSYLLESNKSIDNLYTQLAYLEELSSETASTILTDKYSDLISSNNFQGILFKED